MDLASFQLGIKNQMPVLGRPLSATSGRKAKSRKPWGALEPKLINHFEKKQFRHPPLGELGLDPPQAMEWFRTMEMDTGTDDAHGVGKWVGTPPTAFHKPKTSSQTLGVVHSLRVVPASHDFKHLLVHLQRGDGHHGKGGAPSDFKPAMQINRNSAGLPLEFPRVCWRGQRQKEHEDCPSNCFHLCSNQTAKI